MKEKPQSSGSSAETKESRVEVPIAAIAAVALAWAKEIDSPTRALAHIGNPLYGILDNDVSYSAQIEGENVTIGIVKRPHHVDREVINVTLPLSRFAKVLV